MLGEQFIAELSSLYESYGRSDARESIAMIAAMTMPALLLQKPHHKSKCKEHIQFLTKDWKNGRKVIYHHFYVKEDVLSKGFW